MDDAAHPKSFSISGSALWGIIGVGLYLVVGAGSLFLTALVADPMLAALGLPAEAGQVGLSIRNAIHPIAWGMTVAAASVPIGRRLVPGLRFGPLGNALLSAGLALASITWFLGQELVRARYDWFDPEYVGLSLLAWPAILAIALAGWATLAAPRGQGLALLALMLLAAAGFGLALLPGVIGALNGIEPGSTPLATAFLFEVLYVIAMIVVIARRTEVSRGGS